MAESRLKEIGVRKVLGASVAGITAMLSLDFLKLVVFAILIGTPIGWWVMQRWLQGYDYRISISGWVLAETAFLALGIALMAVCYQSIRAAMSNPVKSLRSE
jgi:ABC-type antimicrobial peptide transport system permease subunit